MTGPVRKGLVAGAAGATALNAVTYLDMALRGRPASSTPDQLVERLLALAGTDLPGEGQERTNRYAGLGPVAGIATATGVGVVAALARSGGLRTPSPVGAVATGALAMAAADLPLALTGVSDPRTWTRQDWLLDGAAHLAFGLVAHRTLTAFERAQARGADPVAATLRRRRRKAARGTYLRALALGGASGGRSTYGPAALALSSPRRPAVAAAAAAAALAESVADKLPVTPDRTLPPSLAGRTAAGAVAGLSLARREGVPAGPAVVLGGLGALAASFAGLQARRLASSRLPTWAPGLVEDVAWAGTAAWGASRVPR